MIELSDMSERELSKLATLAVNPQAQRLGYSDKKRYLIERDLSLAVIKGKSDLLWLAERYSRSYTAGRLPTVNQYRDYLVSRLLVEFVRDLQYYKDSNRLTAHSVNAWLEFGYKGIWPYIDKNTSVPSIYGWGPLGSLSFYAYYSPTREMYAEDTWQKLIEDCLRLVWLSVGQEFDVKNIVTTPNERLSLFLKSMGITEEFVVLVEELFKSTYRSTATTRRQRGETLGSINRPKHRIIFGEYSTTLYQESLELAPEKLRVDFALVRNKLLSVLKPVGVRLLLQAIVVESLYSSILLLTKVSAVWKDQPLMTYIKFDDYTSFGMDDVKRKIAENWITISDAQYLQHFFNDPPAISIPDSRNLSLWLAGVNDLKTDLDASFRLSSFL